MKSEASEPLWRFFLEYWDDHILYAQSEPVFVNARTIRVLQSIHGKPTVAAHLNHWVAEGSIRILGDAGGLEPDRPCVEMLDYVSELPPPDKTGLSTEPAIQ